jgi:hypothetical protein
MEKKKIINYLLLIILLAFTVRTVKVLTNPIICRDSVLYLKMAKTWAELGVNDAYKLYTRFDPVYMFVLAMGQKYLDLKPETTGNIAGVLLGSLIPLALFFIAASLFNSNYRLALIAALLAAIHPYLIRMSSLILRGAIYLPLLSFTFVFAVSAIKNRSVLKWCLFSLFFTVAAMTRHEAFYVLYAFLIWAIYELFASKQTLLLRFRYVILSSCFVIVIYFGLTYMVRLLLSVFSVYR